ncbi:MAG: DUF2805 domain-containing protein [Chitinophagaceae bacterium]|nr:DUF2805 domain-containing protein [Chitinophagaceae bacterium]
MEQKDIDRIIEMRLKDRTLFEAIKREFGKIRGDMIRITTPGSLCICISALILKI